MLKGASDAVGCCGCDSRSDRCLRGGAQHIRAARRAFSHRGNQGGGGAGGSGARKEAALKLAGGGEGAGRV